jgi:putative ubiquitin-RnfH superfamily antitoxin RatB of RatAB toxin-antitoxin module
MAGSEGLLTVEVVYALAEAQDLIEIKIVPGTTVRKAIMQSGILQRYPQIDLAADKVGIFGRVVELDVVLEEGDRVEIYRPLLTEPKDARRQRARQKR